MNERGTVFITIIPIFRIFLGAFVHSPIPLDALLSSLSSRDELAVVDLVLQDLFIKCEFYSVYRMSLSVVIQRPHPAMSRCYLSVIAVKFYPAICNSAWKATHSLTNTLARSSLYPHTFVGS